MKKTSTTNAGEGHGIAIATGIAALAAAAAGAYFFYGSKKAPARRHEVRSWMLKAKGDVLQKMESLKEVNKDVYHAVVTEVADKYAKLKNVDAAELAALVANLKSHWNDINKEINDRSKKTKKLPAKRAAKKA